MQNDGEDYIREAQSKFDTECYIKFPNELKSLLRKFIKKNGLKALKKIIYELEKES